MPNTVRLKDFAKTATTLASDDYIYAGGQANGTRKILGSNLANYVASEEGGNTLASLSGGKVPTAQLPWTGETFLGTSTVASLPAPGGLSAGEYYITTDSGTNHSVTFAAGDKAISDGTSYYAVADGVRPIGEGGTGASTAEGARTNLEVDSKDQIAEGLTRGEPSLWFDGSADYVSVPDNAALSFTNGTDDLPFSVSAWVKIETLSSQQSIISKYVGSGNREWIVYVNSSGYVVVYFEDSGGDATSRTSTSLPITAGEWVHVGVAYDGAGPNSSNDFNVASDGVDIFINGKSASATSANNGNYGGMSDTGGAVEIFRHSGGDETDGEMRNVQIFQSALSASDVETIYRSGVPFELSQAQAGDSVTDGGFENWDSATDLTDWLEGSSGTSTVNRESSVVDSGTYSVRLDLDGSSSYASISQNAVTPGQRYNVTIRARGDGSSLGLQFGNVSNGAAYHSTGYVLTTSWTTYSFSFVATAENFAIGRMAGSASSSSIYIDNVSVRAAGAILDLNAADATISGSNINLPDRSPNGFSGTSSGMSLAANAVNLPAAISANHPNPSSGEALCSLGNNGTEVFKVDDSGNVTASGIFGSTGTWTPTLTFGGNSTGITYGSQVGQLRRIGDIVVAYFEVTITAVGSSTGVAKVEGFPETGHATLVSMGGAVSWCQNLTGLTSAVSMLYNPGSDDVSFYDTSATGMANLTEANFTATSQIRGTVVYLAQ